MTSIKSSKTHIPSIHHLIVDKINLRGVVTIVKKEYEDTIRNRWLIIISSIFFILSIIVSYFGISGRGIGFHSIKDTVMALISLISFLVPIIAIMLGHGSIVNEREKGSLNILLSYPLTRTEVFIGKYIGLGIVLLTTIFIGFGGAGIVIAIGSNWAVNWLSYALFLIATFIVGMVFLGFSMVISVIAKKRSTAIGGAIFIWFFFTMIIGLLLLGIYAATGGDIGEYMGGNLESIPDWLWKAMFFSPLDTYQMFVTLLYDVRTFFGFVVPAIPSYVNIKTTFLGIFVWSIVSPILAILLFRKRDL